jgi:hypothetical protein
MHLTATFLFFLRSLSQEEHLFLCILTFVCTKRRFGRNTAGLTDIMDTSAPMQNNLHYSGAAI